MTRLTARILLEQGSRNANLLRKHGVPNHAAMRFIADLSTRLAHRVQLTSDGHRPYLEAVEAVFGEEIDYAMLQKIYGATAEGGSGGERKTVSKGTQRAAPEDQEMKSQLVASIARALGVTVYINGVRMLRCDNACRRRSRLRGDGAGRRQRHCHTRL